jgi:hypothetical protein
MPDSLESLCDVVELSATEHRIPLARLWERVFAAIRDGDLDFGFPDEFESAYGNLKHRIPLPRPWAPDHVPESQIETLCTSALRAIENGDAFPPWTQLWVRRMLVSAAAFDKWIKEENRKRQFPAHKKRQAGAKSTAVAISDFIERTYPGGVPASVTNQEIANTAHNAGIVGRDGNPVNERTVRRARGGK